tara:strand:+ start:423 stop:1283 length:861 start_codon:yes stop_codon:yes gene_type:complete
MSPDPVTIAQEETPSMSPEQETYAKDVALIDGVDLSAPTRFAGKYETVQELEKGYAELQNKLGSQSNEAPKETKEVEAPEATDTPEATESEPSESTEAGNATEIYGEYIGSRLDEAGVDYEGMNTRWQESGKLSEEDYTSLEGAGFTKDMVEAYLDGVQYRAAQDSQLAAKEVTAIKDEFGGAENYEAMVKFAQENWDTEEIQAFDNMLQTSNPHQIRIAVAGLQASYMNNAPREPKLVGGRTSRADTTKFKSAAQVVAAMNDERYSSDEAYRKEVQEKLGRSNVM